MGKQVVQFFPDGSVAHTRDKNLDVAGMLGGRRAINRMTDIQFSETRQKFYIQFLRGRSPEGINLAGLVFCEVDISGDGDDRLPCVEEIELDDEELEASVAYFDTYEEAVTHEIDLVNRLRHKGYTF